MSRFIILDPGLRGFIGHYFENAVHVLEAASRAGLSPLLVAHRSCPADIGQPFGVPVLPTYTHDCGGARQGPRGWTVGSLNERIEAFAAETGGLLDAIAAGPGDTILLSSCQIEDVVGLVQLVKGHPNAREVSWHLLFRASIPRTRTDGCEAIVASWRVAFRQLLGCLPPEQVHLYADTDFLAADLSFLLEGLPFGTIPYPVNPTLRPAHLPRPAGRPLRVVYFGDARREKGFGALPYVTHRLWSRYVETGQVEFVIQCNLPNPPCAESDTAMARWHLAQMAGPGLRLLPEALTSDAYRDLILSADVALLPYDSNRYFVRSSGVLIEALSAGVPAIVPSGTWMSDQLAGPSAAYLADLPKRAPVVATGDIERLTAAPTGAHTAIRLPQPGGADAAIVTLRLQSAGDLPVPAYVLAQQIQSGLGDTICGRSRAVLGRFAGGGDARSWLFRIAPQAQHIALGLANAYEAQPLPGLALHVDYLDTRHAYPGGCPLGSVGLTAAAVEDVPELIMEMVQHHDHYRDGAWAHAGQWARDHSPERLVAMIAAGSRQEVAVG